MAGFNDWLEVTDPKLLAETIAERFRLSQKELQKAQEALAPAFSLGLRRAMETPAAWAQLAGAFAAMVPGSAAAAPKGLPGQAFLDTFFGSDALTGAVARQASLFAGIAPDTIQKLMPSLAMLTMETMVRATMANVQRHQPEGLASGDFGGATAEMMRRGANAVEALSRPSDAASLGTASPWTAPAAFPPASFQQAFADALTAFPWMPQGERASAPPRQAPQPPQAASPAAGFNPMLPFAAMFDAFAKGMQSAIADTGDEGKAKEGETPPPAVGGMPPTDAMGATRDASRTPAPEAPSASTQDDTLVGELMRSGQKFQDDYAKEMAALFDRYQRADRPL